jgi:hypothetical protein
LEIGAVDVAEVPDDSMRDGWMGTQAKSEDKEDDDSDSDESQASGASEVEDEHIMCGYCGESSKDIR